MYTIVFQIFYIVLILVVDGTGELWYMSLKRECTVVVVVVVVIYNTHCIAALTFILGGK